MGPVPIPKSTFNLLLPVVLPSFTVAVLLLGDAVVLLFSEEFASDYVILSTGGEAYLTWIELRDVDVTFPNPIVVALTLDAVLRVIDVTGTVAAVTFTVSAMVQELC